MVGERQPAVTILGRGRVGRSLADALLAAGVPVALLPARDERSWPQSWADGDDGRSGGATNDRLVLLAVPDGAIAGVAERARQAVDRDRLGPDGTDAGGLDGDRTGGGGARPAVVHLSGASGFGPLEPLRAAGFPVGIAHPFAAFPEARPPAAFRGVTFGVAASTPGLQATLSDLTSAIGAVPQAVAADGWVAYHAAGVMASNYLVVLAAQASKLLERVGFDRDTARDALLPLMRGTLDNLEREGVDNALSGPLRRGDVATVERHLSLLDEADPEVAALYRALALPAIDLAIGTGLDEDAAERLRRTVG